MAAYYKIVSHSGNGLPLSVNSANIIGSRTEVVLQTSSAGDNQKWLIENTSSTSGQAIRTRSNLVFMLNAHRKEWGGDVYTDNEDTKIKLVPLGNDLFRLQLASVTNRYLTASGTTSGSGVTWQPLNSSSDSQKWKLVKQTTPAYPSNFTYTKKTINGITLYILETPATNIGLVNVVKQSTGVPAQYCGCNAGFFDNEHAASLETYNIAMNGRVAVGPEDAGTYNTCGKGNIALVNGQIQCFEANDIQEVLKKYPSPTWVQGGGMMFLGDPNWKDKWSFPHDPESSSTGRTALVSNKKSKKVYLVVGISSTSKTITQFRTALQSHFDITDGSSTDYVGLMLDGGGSSTLRLYQNGTRTGPNTSRKLCQILYLKQ